MHIALSQMWPWSRSKITPSERLVGWIFLGLAILAGATLPSFALQLTQTFSPFSVLFIGEVSIIFFLLLSFGAMRIVRELLSLNAREFGLLIVMAVVVSIGLVLWFVGLHTTGAANVEILEKVELMLILIFSATFLRETFTRYHIIAAFMILSGVFVVFLRNVDGGFRIETGDFYIFIAAVFFATGSTLFKRNLHTLPPEVVLFVRASVSLLLFFIVSPFLKITFIAEMQYLTVGLIIPLLGYVFFSRFLSVLSFYESIERLPLSTIYLFLPLRTIFSISFAHFYLGEGIYWHQFVGGGLIILGTLTLNVFGLHKTPEHAVQHMKQHHGHH
ncbi:hypothetical protein COU77_01645 [Candidatus Peregrinibacteria bacterium CG10_big_fil_rev_8_21_14_0_10_49_16]|nr:MAG: hypothetical protein COU77_01645 [Candidatus Peregrinibacteria bacterium CG10_big_fil_rev_8_21_14_0_10_49_16]